MWLRIYQHLLPNAKAWRITVEKNLRSFFEGLTGLPSDIRDFFDLIWLDIFPDTTRQLSEWEAQFGLPDTVLTEQERRDRLDAAWKAQGGQSPSYIQETLQAAGFPVFVHEWWQLPVVGSPVPRNPLSVLNDGSADIEWISCDGNDEMMDGGDLAYEGSILDLTGYPLVNKILVKSEAVVSDGYDEMMDGGTIALDGYGGGYNQKVYPVPNDPTLWPYFLYIGGEVFPDHATIPASRKNEFETLCLKICPAQQWLGILVDYT